ncbi:MAG TPA: asparagine synthase (glutamine-hydrolyzing) [Polyangiaceae bacterium]|jgi:asparagine synthase (glutamine-hydrolysing)
MCGITGTQDTPAAGAAVAAMLEALVHRGPDDGGRWHGGGWCVGMRRLAIMDPGHGRQPMVSSDGRWALVFNGELYNFRRQRELLLGNGAVFTTNTDTEVLLELIVRQGVLGALARLEGMFAFAAVDTAAGDLWLARDRFGEKPLYIDRRDGRFSFCSELWPLLSERGAPSPHISGRGVMSILRFGHPWPGVTAVEGVAELRPGQWLRRSRSGTETAGTYWSPPDRIDEAAGSIDRCGARLLDMLDCSVRDRLVADVPLGLFLSGGIDSAAIASSAVRERGDIQAITVGFDARGYDETPLARATASRLGIELKIERGTIPLFSQDVFDDLLIHHGQPFADTSAVPTRLVSRAARRQFKVVLSGDGGDELLAGYLAHARQVRLARWGGGRLGAAVASVVRRASRGQTRESIDRGLALVASVPRGLLPHVMAGVFSDEMVSELVEGTPWARETSDHLEEARDDSRGLWQAVPDPCLALSLYQLRHSLPQDILAKVDRMSMAESLEVRAPFFDSRLASYALSLPPRIKLRGEIGKYVLRQALRTRLPPAVLSAPKRGFAMPVRDWLGGEFWQLLGREVAAYAADGASELNSRALVRRVRLDEDRCRTVNDYRAVHRGVLLYGFLRWRSLLSGVRRRAGGPRSVS